MALPFLTTAKCVLSSYDSSGAGRDARGVRRSDNAYGYNAFDVPLPSTTRVHDQVKAMGMKQVLSAVRSPWQGPMSKRLIGSLRGEWLVDIIIFGERSLRRALASWASSGHSWCTYLSLGKDTCNSDEHRPGQG